MAKSTLGLLAGAGAGRPCMDDPLPFAWEKVNVHENCVQGSHENKADDGVSRFRVFIPVVSRAIFHVRPSPTCLVSSMAYSALKLWPASNPCCISNPSSSQFAISSKDWGDITRDSRASKFARGYRLYAASYATKFVAHAELTYYDHQRGRPQH